ncbi:hypothetical protein TGMAS_239580 [Toxoplasma gondii MAS]|uniref:Uncharacterized protein n=1 Tax=Toxoplasma gondii MAS TaxID=943118 RepID=A0A086QQ62_TOXGO|nr:hypothetical protein TGMAS_239580 [Toxoplasma gondii MAS]
MVVTENEEADRSRSLAAAHDSSGTSDHSDEDTRNPGVPSTDRTFGQDSHVHILDKETLASCNLNNQGLCLAGIEPVDTPPSHESELSPTSSIASDKSPDCLYPEHGRIGTDDLLKETDASSSPIQTFHSLTDADGRSSDGQKDAGFCGCTEDSANWECWKREVGIETSGRQDVTAGKTRLPASSTGDPLYIQVFHEGTTNADSFVGCPPEERDALTGIEQVEMPAARGMEESSAVSSEDESIVILSSDMDSGDDTFEELFVDRNDPTDAFDGITGDEGYGVLLGTESPDGGAVSEGESVDPEYLDEENSDSEAQDSLHHPPRPSPQLSLEVLLPISNLDGGEHRSNFERRPLLPPLSATTLTPPSRGSSFPVASWPVSTLMSPSDYPAAFSIPSLPAGVDSSVPSVLDSRCAVESQLELALGSLSMYSSCSLPIRLRGSSHTLISFTREESPLCQTGGPLLASDMGETEESKADSAACFKRLSSPDPAQTGPERGTSCGYLSERDSFPSEAQEMGMCSLDAASSPFAVAVCDETTPLLADASRQASRCDSCLPHSPRCPLTLSAHGRVVSTSIHAESLDNRDIVCVSSSRYSSLPTSIRDEEENRAIFSYIDTPESIEVGRGHGIIPAKCTGQSQRQQRTRQGSSPGLTDWFSWNDSGLTCAKKQPDAHDRTNLEFALWKLSEGVGHSEAVEETDERGRDGQDTVNVTEEGKDSLEDEGFFQMPSGEGREQPGYRDEELLLRHNAQQCAGHEEENIADRDHVEWDDKKYGHTLLDDGWAGLPAGDERLCQTFLKGGKETRRGTTGTAAQHAKKPKNQREEQHEQSFRSVETEDFLEDDVLENLSGARHNNGDSEPPHSAADGKQSSSGIGCHSQHKTEDVNKMTPHAEEFELSSRIDGDRSAMSPDRRQENTDLRQGPDGDEDNLHGSSKKARKRRWSMSVSSGQAPPRRKKERKRDKDACASMPSVGDKRLPGIMAPDTQDSSKIHEDARESSPTSISPSYCEVRQDDNEEKIGKDNDVYKQARVPDKSRETRKRVSFFEGAPACTACIASLFSAEHSNEYLLNQLPSVSTNNTPDRLLQTRFSDEMSGHRLSSRQKLSKSRETAGGEQKTKRAEESPTSETKESIVMERGKQSEVKMENNTEREDAMFQEERQRTNEEERLQDACPMHFACAELPKQECLAAQGNDEDTVNQGFCSEDSSVEHAISVAELKTAKEATKGNERMRLWTQWTEEDEDDFGDCKWREKEMEEVEGYTAKNTRNTSADRGSIHVILEGTNDPESYKGVGVGLLDSLGASGTLPLLAEQSDAAPTDAGTETEVRGRKEERGAPDQQEKRQEQLLFPHHKSARWKSLPLPIEGTTGSDRLGSGEQILLRRSISDEGTSTRHAHNEPGFHLMRTDRRTALQASGRPFGSSEAKGVHAPGRFAGTCFARDSQVERFTLDLQVNHDNHESSCLARPTQPSHDNGIAINDSHDPACPSEAPESVTIPQLCTGTRNMSLAIEKKQNCTNQNRDGSEIWELGDRDEEAEAIRADGALAPAASLLTPEGCKETNGQEANLSSFLAGSSSSYLSPSTRVSRDGLSEISAEKNSDCNKKSEGKTGLKKEERMGNRNVDDSQGKEEPERVVTRTEQDGAAGLTSDEKGEKDKHDEVTATPSVDEDFPLLSTAHSQGRKKNGARRQANGEDKKRQSPTLFENNRSKQTTERNRKPLLAPRSSSDFVASSQGHAGSVSTKTEHQGEQERPKAEAKEEGDKEKIGDEDARAEALQQGTCDGSSEGKTRVITDVPLSPYTRSMQIEPKQANAGDSEMWSANKREREKLTREATGEVAQGSVATDENAAETVVQQARRNGAYQERWGEAIQDSENRNVADFEKKLEVQALPYDQEETKQLRQVGASDSSDGETDVLTKESVLQMWLRGENARGRKTTEDRNRGQCDDQNGSDDGDEGTETTEIKELDGSKARSGKTEETENMRQAEDHKMNIQHKQGRRRRGQRRREHQEYRRQRKQTQLQEERLKEVVDAQAGKAKMDEQERKARDVEEERKDQDLRVRHVDEGAHLKKADNRHNGTDLKREHNETRQKESNSERHRSTLTGDTPHTPDFVSCASSGVRSSVLPSSLQTAGSPPSSICLDPAASVGRQATKNIGGKRKQALCHHKTPQPSSSSSFFHQHSGEGSRGRGEEIRRLLAEDGERTGRSQQLSKWTVWAVLLLVWTWGRPVSVQNYI